ncbi:MAG: PHP domain-containing protein [Pseudomonadota bacterium]
MRADLHVHTTASDGTLSPAAIVARAVEHGVELLSITDHDTLAAYDALQVPSGLTMITGVELSARWDRMTVHIVGLGVDRASPAMVQAQKTLLAARAERAARIAEKLAPLGLDDPLAAAQRHACGAAVGRPHFASALVEAGIVTDAGEAFRRYLGAGKRGDVGHFWPEQATVIEWILAAGGVAVLAHPLHYRMTMSRLKRLLRDFVAQGGSAIEVLSGRQNADEIRRTTLLARQFGLAASCGSDFHRPHRYGPELGCTGPLPAGLIPVWERITP